MKVGDLLSYLRACVYHAIGTSLPAVQDEDMGTLNTLDRMNVWLQNIESESAVATADHS